MQNTEPKSHQCHQLPAIKQHAGRIVQFSSGWIFTAMLHKILSLAMEQICTSVWVKYSHILHLGGNFAFVMVSLSAAIQMSLHPTLSFSASICLCSSSFDTLVSVFTIAPCYKLSHFTFLQRSQAELYEAVKREGCQSCHLREATAGVINASHLSDAN